MALYGDLFRRKLKILSYGGIIGRDSRHERRGLGMPVVAVASGDGAGKILIEVDSLPPADDLEAIYEDAEDVRGKVAEKVVEAGRPLFQEGLGLVRECAEQVVGMLDGMEESVRPDEFEMQLAVKLDTKVGAKIVELTGGAQLMVTLRWHAE